jgi:hydroxypyruvate isomerase
MAVLAANLTMMFTEWAFLDRFAAAADAGFTAVEFLFPYAYEPDAIAQKLQRHSLTQALFNLPPGDWDRGERGLAALPARRDEFRASVAIALRYAEATGVGRLHVMSGVADRDDVDAMGAWRDAMAFACDEAGARGLDIVIEPLNARDNPGYFLNDFASAAALIGALGRGNFKLQYDIYHRQIMHGDVSVSLKDMMPLIGHIQIASVPARNEPGSGELNDAMILRAIDALGYRGFVGCEYRPAAGTLAGLGWIKTVAG